MNCFYHPNTGAVGICYYCNRALCEECAKDYSRGLACKGHCENKVEGMLTSRGKILERHHILLKPKKQQRNAPLSPEIIRWIVVCIFSALIIALITVHLKVHAANLRLSIELSDKSQII